MNRALRDGKVLLLIDGLDEIASESVRVGFVKQLRPFLSRYPQVSVVVTPREAGFRVVGTALINHCDHYHLADFDQHDITRAVVASHRQVVGNRKFDRSGKEPTIELFDLRNDKAEKNNLVDKNPKFANDLQQQLRDWQQSVLRSLTGADYR